MFQQILPEVTIFPQVQLFHKNFILIDLDASDESI